MGWRTGRITFEPDEPPPERTIPIPSEQLLLNWSSKKIEWEKVREKIPSNSAVFRLSLQNNGESKTLSAEQWNVLALSNGARNVSEIARVLNWDEFKVVKAIFQLVRAGLMEHVGEQQPVKKKLVRENFFLAVEKELKNVMGAVSSFIIDDKLTEFGEKRESFPQEKLLSFVEALGEEIPQDDKRKEFKKAVMEFFSLEK
jgi:hypothetical protein